MTQSTWSKAEGALNRAVYGLLAATASAVMACGGSSEEAADSMQEREIRVLISELGNKERDIRDRAVAELRRIGKPAVSEVLAVLQDREPMVRVNAARALGGIGYHAEAAVPRLIQVLEDEDALVRAEAAIALGSISSHGDASERTVKTSVRALTIMLEEREDWRDRHQAAWALAEIGPQAEAAVPALLEALKGDDDGVQQPAAEALGSIGPGAKAAIPDLLQVFKHDRGGGVRQSSARALGPAKK